MPLQSGDVMAALREAEAKLRKEGREKADLAKLGPGALELASLMDRTASFLLSQLPAALTAATPSDGYVVRARSGAAGSGGRLAAPFPDVPPASQATVGAFAMTTQGFEMLVSSLTTSLTSVDHYSQNCPPPCSVTKTFDPTTDEVTVAGNKAKITTTVTAVATVNGSKVTLDITVKIEGEARDAATGAFLYRIEIEATGHADGDACPDPSGTARARLVFGGSERYFHANGTRSESAIGGGWNADLRIKVDDDAKLAGVDLTTTGGEAAHFIMGLSTARIAPSFEKVWRSGGCIEVLVSPKGGKVEKDSVTTVTAKVKHKIEGNELDKQVEAKLGRGVKSIDPAGSKQKAPATFKYTAGSKEGDYGDVSFESVSNRGIGRTFVTFCVACADWTINSVGTSNEQYDVAGLVNDLKVSINDLKVTVEDTTLTGSGTMTITGRVSVSYPGAVLVCDGQLDQTSPITVRGTLVGKRAIANDRTIGPTVLRLRLYAPSDPSAMVAVTCRIPFTGAQTTASIGAQGYSERYGDALGEFDLPADRGATTTTVTRSASIGGLVNVRATGTFTVLPQKP